MTRPIPPPLDVPAVPPLRVARPMRGVRPRLAAWGAWATTLLALGAWGALWGFVVPVNWPALACIAVPGGVSLLGALALFSGPLVDEVLTRRLWWVAATQEVQLRYLTVTTPLRVQRLYARIFQAPAPVEPPERVILHRVGDGQMARVPAVEPEPVVSDQTTRRLPPLPAGLACAPILAALIAGERVSFRALPDGWSREAFGRQVAFLVDAGIVVNERGRPLALAPRYRGLPEHVVWDDARRVAGVL